MGSPGEVTRLLQAHQAGDVGALDRLVPLVYDDLRRLARRQLAGHRRGHLDTTALVHEVYLKLVDQTRIPGESRRHFLAVAARAMRQVVVDFARRRQARKRGGEQVHLTLDAATVAVEEEAEMLLALDEALRRLGELDPRLIRVVECRFFAGLSEEETAGALALSTRTVQRDWTRARAWLQAQLAG
ncbi:MAG TPA: ECF-type sigma factor [Thermoanaerobaculia bacterium]|nr:ECF-type sigma factor [Thermoanaerobaculia bacterium]